MAIWIRLWKRLRNRDKKLPLRAFFYSAAAAIRFPMKRRSFFAHSVKSCLVSAVQRKLFRCLIQRLNLVSGHCVVINRHIADIAHKRIASRGPFVPDKKIAV